MSGAVSSFLGLEMAYMAVAVRPSLGLVNAMYGRFDLQLSSGESKQANILVSGHPGRFAQPSYPPFRRDLELVC